MDKAYIDTVRLLLDVLPVVFAQPNFAMKGGTAINLFAADMPRLSVDIDVVYIDHRIPREQALRAISSNLEAIRKTLKGRGLETEAVTMATGEEIRMFVRHRSDLVKVEVNHVFRGTVIPVVPRPMTAATSTMFAREITVPILATAELYGSKLVAALDRQHPRDFFDVLGMYERHGLSPEIVECFVCYLAGHNRPVHEVLFSRDQDMKRAFENELVGMTREPIALETLVEVRRRLRADLAEALTPNQRTFLLGLVSGKPDWSLMQSPHLAELPAIRWKLENITRLEKSNRTKFTAQSDELRVRMKA